MFNRSTSRLVSAVAFTLLSAGVASAQSGFAKISNTGAVLTNGG